ncbi:hypothetical protein HK098_006851 [Nowakowskiella sp. JEL0407]|nr:hypothetical protein HK098_006851 [Nowakowskiella sp. JEL0407]
MDEEPLASFFDAIVSCDKSLLISLLENKHNESLFLSFLLTKNFPNDDHQFSHDKDLLNDACELLGPSVANLNAIQIACMLGDEDMAIEILEFVYRITNEMEARKVMYEFLGRVWGSGNTVLHLAAFHGMSMLVEKLITHGANPNKKNDRGYRPVDCTDDHETRKAFTCVSEASRPREEPRSPISPITDQKFTFGSFPTNNTKISSPQEKIQSLPITPSSQSVPSQDKKISPSHLKSISSSTSELLSPQSHADPKQLLSPSKSIDSLLLNPNNLSNSSKQPPTDTKRPTGILISNKSASKLSHQRRRVTFDPSTMMLQISQFGDPIDNVSFTALRRCLGLPLQDLKIVDELALLAQISVPSLSEKLDINKIISPQQRLTPLHLACTHGHVEMVKVLLKELDIKVNVRDREGWTPLHCAAAEGHVQIIKMLVCCQGRKDPGGKIVLEPGVKEKSLVGEWFYPIDGPVNLEPETFDGEKVEDVALEEKSKEIKKILADMRKRFPNTADLDEFLKNQPEEVESEEDNEDDEDDEEEQSDNEDDEKPSKTNGKTLSENISEARKNHQEPPTKKSQNQERSEKNEKSTTEKRPLSQSVVEKDTEDTKSKQKQTTEISKKNETLSPEKKITEDTPQKQATEGTKKDKKSLSTTMESEQNKQRTLAEVTRKDQISPPTTESEKKSKIDEISIPKGSEPKALDKNIPEPVTKDSDNSPAQINTAIITESSKTSLKKSDFADYSQMLKDSINSTQTKNEAREVLNESSVEKISPRLASSNEMVKESINSTQEKNEQKAVSNESSVEIPLKPKSFEQVAQISETAKIKETANDINRPPVSQEFNRFELEKVSQLEEPKILNEPVYGPKDAKPLIKSEKVLPDPIKPSETSKVDGRSNFVTPVSQQIPPLQSKPDLETSNVKLSSVSTHIQSFKRTESGPEDESASLPLSSQSKPVTELKISAKAKTQEMDSLTNGINSEQPTVSKFIVDLPHKAVSGTKLGNSTDLETPTVESNTGTSTSQLVLSTTENATLTKDAIKSPPKPEPPISPSPPRYKSSTSPQPERKSSTTPPQLSPKPQNSAKGNSKNELSPDFSLNKRFQIPEKPRKNSFESSPPPIIPGTSIMNRIAQWESISRSLGSTVTSPQKGSAELNDSRSSSFSQSSVNDSTNKLPMEPVVEKNQSMNKLQVKPEDPPAEKKQIQETLNKVKVKTEDPKVEKTQIHATMDKRPSIKEPTTETTKSNTTENDLTNKTQVKTETPTEKISIHDTMDNQPSIKEITTEKKLNTTENDTTSKPQVKTDNPQVEKNPVHEAIDKRPSVKETAQTLEKTDKRPLIKETTTEPKSNTTENSRQLSIKETTTEAKSNSTVTNQQLKIEMNPSPQRIDRIQEKQDNLNNSGLENEKLKFKALFSEVSSLRSSSNLSNVETLKQETVKDIITVITAREPSNSTQFDTNSKQEIRKSHEFSDRSSSVNSAIQVNPNVRRRSSKEILRTASQDSELENINQTPTEFETLHDESTLTEIFPLAANSNTQANDYATPTSNSLASSSKTTSTRLKIPQNQKSPFQPKPTETQPQPKPSFLSKIYKSIRFLKFEKDSNPKPNLPTKSAMSIATPTLPPTAQPHSCKTCKSITAWTVIGRSTPIKCTNAKPAMAVHMHATVSGSRQINPTLRSTQPKSFTLPNFYSGFRESGKKTEQKKESKMGKTEASGTNRSLRRNVPISKNI